MKEIARCPHCNENPSELGRDSYSRVGISCCGVSIWTRDNPDHWNQYAAAMELAKAALQREVTDMMDAPASTSGSNFFRAKLCRVLEVFGK